MGKNSSAKHDKTKPRLPPQTPPSRHNDLFNNPMAKAAEAAFAALDEEEKTKFRLIGEALYGDCIDYGNSKVLDNLPEPMAEAVAYVHSGLTSGLHPSDLDDNEKNLMQDVYGEEWYEKYGYVKEDLDSIVTLK